jgi:hypothetical protein
MRKIYALVNHSTGEVYTCEGEGITCQTLYKRALSCRRGAVYYEDMQDYITLLRVDGYGYDSLHNGIVIQQWQGGMNTPLEDMGLCVSAFYPLKKRGCKTAEDVAIIVKSCAVWTFIPRKALIDLARILRQYDEAAARVIIRRINENRRAPK